MPNLYADKATNLLFAWEHNCHKDLSVGDRETLHMMLTEALQETAWAAQQPGAPLVSNPKS